MSRRFEENQLRAWTDAQGSGVGDDTDMARDYAIIVGTTAPLGITNNYDVKLEVLGPAAGVTYVPATGILTLGIGKTYLLQAALHMFSFSNLTEWTGFAFVDLANNRVGFGSVGFSGPGTAPLSSDTSVPASTVHTPTSVANNQVKLRIDAGYSALNGTATMNGSYSWITVQQLG